jgi:hypothetical protein
VQVRAGAPFVVPFQDPRNPKAALWPAARLPLYGMFVAVAVDPLLVT